MSKMWAGRFDKSTDKRVDDYQSSLPFDRRMYREDIEGSVAHATMLGETGVLPAPDVKAIVQGLGDILRDMDEGRVALPEDAEDIHMLVEAELTRRIGEAGKRLHTGRSRNDQVALDARLYARRACDETLSLIRALRSVLLTLAEAHADDVMPGYTHLQRAQPITAGHWLCAYAQMLTRDMRRFEFARASCDSMPLGAGALAGTTYPIDRPRVAELLGFTSVALNSLDAVSDRDFMLDYLSAASVCMMHLSRLCEEIVLYASGEFGFITLDDGFSTGSSMMPQKKNPDVAELTRGKTGRVYGDLMALLTVMKGLPLAYNKDMQEDKEAFFDAQDTLCAALRILAPMLDSMTFNAPRMREAAAGGFTNATDLADYLTARGLPFRDAHHVAGALVAACLRAGQSLCDVPLETLKTYCPLFESDVYDAISLSACVARRALVGGPAPDTVRACVRAMREHE